MQFTTPEVLELTFAELPTDKSAWNGREILALRCLPSLHEIVTVRTIRRLSMAE